jgi:cytochrome c oxidase subunit II
MEGILDIADWPSALDLFGSQSTLDPAGLGAAEVYPLTVWMTWAFGAVFVLVMAFVLLAWLRRHPARSWWIWAGGIVLPLVAIVAVLVFSTAALVATTREAPTRWSST